MWLQSISDDFQAAQFYTCSREQMVLADSVWWRLICGGGVSQKWRARERGGWSLQSTGEGKKEVKVMCKIIHITCTEE